MRDYLRQFFPGKIALVVDDDETVRTIAVILLRQLGIPEIIEARDGCEALAIYREKKDDIILIMSDINMPNMDGEQLFWHLHKINKHIRMILCSGYLNGTDIKKMMKAGLIGFIEKPFNCNDLQQLLNQAYF